MTPQDAAAAIRSEARPNVPRVGASRPTHAEYLAAIAEVIFEARSAMWNSREQTEAIPFVRQIGALALAALDENGQFGDAALSFAVAETSPDPGGSITEHLLDIESIVIRYKAHRPQLKSVDAQAKVANNLVEILVLCAACLARHA